MTTRYHILLYHGVCPDGAGDWPRNSSGKHVSQSQFDAQMRHLSRARPVVTMHDVAAALRGERSLPDGAVAVTFDDGLGNNYTHAWPILEKYGIAATIYLATGYIGARRMIWTDRLETAILETPRTGIERTFGAQRRAWRWTTTDERVTAFKEIKAACKKMANDAKDTIVDSICAELGCNWIDGHPLYSFMSWDEVRRMAASPLIEFGAHTVDHVALARVGDEEMARQIDASVSCVASELGRPCRLFAYPEGQPDDYDERTIAHLKRRGFDHSPSAVEGVNALPGTAPFHLYRYLVGIDGRPYPFAEL